MAKHGTATPSRTPGGGPGRPLAGGAPRPAPPLAAPPARPATPAQPAGAAPSAGRPASIGRDCGPGDVRLWHQDGVGTNLQRKRGRPGGGSSAYFTCQAASVASFSDRSEACTARTLWLAIFPPTMRLRPAFIPQPSKLLTRKRSSSGADLRAAPGRCSGSGWPCRVRGMAHAS